jgi:tetratricopeptide (TPR) repeat protein
VVTWLCDTGEARLASRAATILKETAATPEQQKDARYLNARALYELDQYKPAEEELAMVSEKDCSIYALWGDIAASRADYPVALENYRAAVNAPGINQALRAHSVRGLGYVLGRLGKVQEAEECLRESINLLTGSEAKRTLAEAWGDLGQLLCNLRRIEDSRDSLERSLALNQELGNLPGIGIVYGLLGELEMVQGHLNEAASHFRESQEIAFRTANRWRQAWVLKRLSQLSAALGDQKEADALLSASREIFNKIGSKGD